MPRFAANLTMLFNDVPFLDRFERAAKAGFTHVEFLFPYAFAAGELRARLHANGLQLVLHNLPAGNWEAGERGMACLPGREAEFKSGVRQAIEYALALEVPQLNCLMGKVPAGVASAEFRTTAVSNLRYAAAELKAAGLKLLIEPINPFDIPGFWLNRTDQALALLDEVDADNAFVQYDLYHAQRVEGEIAATLKAQLARIGHVQIADNPGRNEPGTGELNWHFLFRHLDAIGYSGFVGCEYKPADTGPMGTEAGLGWINTLANTQGSA